MTQPNLDRQSFPVFVIKRITYVLGGILGSVSRSRGGYMVSATRHCAEGRAATQRQNLPSASRGRPTIVELGAFCRHHLSLEHYLIAFTTRHRYPYRPPARFLDQKRRITEELGIALETSWRHSCSQPNGAAISSADFGPPSFASLRSLALAPRSRLYAFATQSVTASVPFPS